MNRKESIEEFKKQQSDSTFCEQTDGFNQQKQNKKVRNEIMKLNANNYISEKKNTISNKTFPFFLNTNLLWTWHRCSVVDYRK